ncbi:protein kinase [Tieghemostelium lacteum]|uniref:Protein kinase n=1 Tax=Tieghemostelium lacteum TaxID=361077 RepID=A0A152A5I1_TIELA|nr:protein kinase [Tieghemostelium lacteum]|eukprot:KYR01337.1 protein kinase [Tieghemostelium lacteum]
MISTSKEELWYNPNEIEHEIDNEVLHDLLKKGCTGELGKEYDQLKNLLFELSIEDRQKATSVARHSLFPGTEKSSPIVQFSKYHLDFSMKEGEKCKVGVVLKDKLLMSNKGSTKVLFNFSNIPIPSKNIKLSFTPSSGSIKKGSSQEIQVEMTVLCTTKVRELICVDISNSGRYLLTIKIDSKMSQVLDYTELEIGGIIGGGGYGVIHKAKWRGLSVAVKAISEMSDGSEFEKELEMHKELLHHPNIVHFVGFCVSPKCLVLEYIEGGSLDKYLGDPQLYNFTPQLRLKMAYDIAKGMCFLHRNEILHLDLKPQNFLVVSLSMEAPVSIKLADFGLATASSRSFYGSTVAGSFLYNSPEVFTQKKFSRAADVWSYGACLIEILTGKRPYQEYDELGYLELARVREEGFPPKIPDEIDSDMKKIIESCLLKDHSKRPSFEHIESFLSLKCQDIISSINDASSGNISGSPGGVNVLSLSRDGSNSSFGSSSSSFLFSKLQQQQQQQQKFTPPRPSTPIPNSDRSGVMSSSPSSPGSGLILPSLLLQRKLPSQTISIQHHQQSQQQSVSPSPTNPIPSTSPRSIVSTSSIVNSLSTPTSTNSSTLLISPTNKVNRAMTEVVTSNQPKMELPTRSTTISSTQFEKPKIINHRPLPVPIPRTQSSQQILVTPQKESIKPTTTTTTTTTTPKSPDTSLSTNGTHVGTKVKPLTSSSSSTPQIQLPSPTHKPLIRAASSVEIKTSNHSTTNGFHLKPVGSTSNNTIVNCSNNNNKDKESGAVINGLNLMKPLSSTTPTSLKLLEEISSTSNQSTTESDHKFSELKLRSLKWLKDHYLSFSNVIRQFSDIKSLKECIELGQKVRNFKKDLELLCIEQLKVGWDHIHTQTKKIISKPHLISSPSPHPSHFDGETYNKVMQLRDAAVIVGESALDGIFYLITQLSPQYFSQSKISPTTSTFSLVNEFNINLFDQKEKLQSNNKHLSQTDKDIIVKIAKVTIGIKDY